MKVIGKKEEFFIFQARVLNNCNISPVSLKFCLLKQEYTATWTVNTTNVFIMRSSVSYSTDVTGKRVKAIKVN